VFKTPYTVDKSVPEILATLIVGAAALVARRAEIGDRVT